jgi:hypothetical protein
MTIRIKTESRACLLDSTKPGSLVHDILAGAPVITRPGDPPGGLYEIECSDADCQELATVASRYCPDALLEIETEIRQRRG